MRQPYGPIHSRSSKAPRSKAIFTDRSTLRVGFSSNISFHLANESRNTTFRWKTNEVSKAVEWQQRKTRSRPAQVLNSLMALLIWKASTFCCKSMFQTRGKPAGDDKELTNRRQFIKFNHQRVRTANFYRISQVSLLYILLNNEQKSLSCFVIISHPTCCLLLFPSPAKVGEWAENERFLQRAEFSCKNI